MNYKIIFTALALVVLVGGLIAFGVTKTASNQNELKVEVENNRTQEKKDTSDKQPAIQKNTITETAPDTVISPGNSAEIMTVAGNPGAAITSETISPAPTPQTIVKGATKTEVKTGMKQKTVGNEIFDGHKIVKTEDEWRKSLTPDQFYVLREKGTEPAYTGKYTDNKEAGEYYCAACGLALFTSKNKFDSETGWVSFYKPIAAVNVLEETDKSLEETRTEVLCARCHSHIGHVFDDGPKPTGLRYCMNSVALDFKKKK